MNKENTNKLFDDFPELYRGKDKSITESPMGFGFGCGDGWLNIVYRLSEDITRMAHAAGTEVPEVTQVKEKFGSLRFYIGPVDNEIADRVYERIHEAEVKSSAICEGCGDVSEVRSRRGYYTTLCDTCFEERTKSREQAGGSNERY